MEFSEYGRMWADISGRCEVTKESHLQPMCYVEIEYKGEYGQVAAMGFSKCEYPDKYDERHGRDIAFVKAVGHAAGKLLIEKMNRLEVVQEEVVEAMERRIKREGKRSWPAEKTPLPLPHIPRPQAPKVAFVKLAAGTGLELFASTPGGVKWLTREAPKFGKLESVAEMKVPSWEACLFIFPGSYDIDEVITYLLQYNDMKEVRCK